MRTQVTRIAVALTVNFAVLTGAAVSGHAAVAPQKLVFVQDPSTCSMADQSTLTGGNVWGSTCQPEVQIENLATNAVVDSQDHVTLSITSGTGASGATLVCSSGLGRYASSGVVGFLGCQIDKASSGYTLTAVDDTNPSPVTMNGTSSSFTISAGPTTQLGVSGIANPDTAGSAQMVTVTAEDAGGNKAGPAYTGTVHFTSTDGAATLPGDGTLSSNTATFPITLKTAGSRTVTATDTVHAAITGSQTVAVNPGAVQSIAIAPKTASVTAGETQAFTTTASDGFGNTIGDETTQTTFSISPDGTCTGGSGTGGAAPGNNQCGSTIADANGSMHTVTAMFSGKSDTASLTVNPAAGHIVFTASPDDPAAVSNGGFETGDFTGWTTGGTIAAPSVSTARAYTGTHAALLGTTGAVEPSDDSTISQSFTVPATSPVLSFVYWPATTDAASDYQEATITCGLCTTNNSVTIFHKLSNAQAWQPVQFSLGYAAGKSVSLTFKVHQDGGSTPTSMFVDDVAVSTQLAGGSFSIQPAVKVVDQFNNTVDTSAPITLGLLSGTGTPGAAVNCAANPVDAVHGIATFSGCSVDTTGYFYQLQATAAAYSAGITATPFSAPGPILGFSQSPSSSTGGVAFPTQPVVDSLQGDGTVDSGDNATSVTLGITAGTGASGAALTCFANPLAVSSGAADFAGCSIDKASGAAYTLTARGLQGAVHALPAVSQAFMISAGPTAEFALSGLSNPSTAGDAQTLTVTPLDAGGNAPASAYAGPVDISFSPAGAGSSTPPSRAAGTCGTSCTFSVQLTKAGSDTVTAGNAASSPTITGSDTTTVNPAATSNFQVTAPGSATAGTSFNVGVTALDTFGNQTGSAYTGAVHLASTDGHAALPADSTLTNGQGTFPVTLNTAGNQTVTATDKTDSSITGVSGTITVTPGAPASITISPKSASIAAGGAETYTVTARDGSGNSIGDVTSQTTFSIGPDGTCTGGSGANQGAPGNSQCGSNTAGAHTVTAMYAGQSDTASLTVMPGAPASITISPKSSTIAAGATQTYTVTADDSFGNSLGDVTSQTTFSIAPDGACAGGSGTGGAAPGNSKCGSSTGGAHTVTAMYAGKSDTASLTVSPCDTPTGAIVSGGPVGGSTYSQPTGSGWTQEPGTANDVGSGGGQTYVVGTTATDGGFNVWHFVNGGWSELPGGLVDIAVGPDGNPWGINSAQDIFHWTGGSWTKLPGSAYDIAAGPGGHVFVIGTTATDGGCNIWEWNGSGWNGWPGGAIKIAAGTNDNPWVINNNDSIFAWNGGWTREPGAAQNIAATTGSVWVIGTAAVGNSFAIYYWTGDSWGQIDGGGVTIAVTTAKLPWVTNGSMQIWRRT